MSDEQREVSPDTFYVGYLPNAPAPVGRFVKRWVTLVIAVAVGVAMVLAMTPSRLPDKVFEWGVPTRFAGVIDAEPVPVLRVARPGRTGERSTWSRFLLVAPGKRGAQALVRGLDGRMVELRGSLIYREDQTMIEIVDGTIQPIDGDDAAADDVTEELGTHTFEGEIVDSKCYLGVMAPGSTKPHKSCAIRCIAGGVPPVLLVRQNDGRALYLLLVGAGGRMINDDVLDLVAEPVSITGSVRRHGDLLILESEPSTYTRLGS